MQSAICLANIEILCGSGKDQINVRSYPLHLVDPTRASEILFPSHLAMSTSSIALSPIQGSCYFSIQHNQQSSYHNDETPLASPFTPSGEDIVSDPSHPLLAYRPFLHSPSTTTVRNTMDSLLQLQTQAAHIPPPRRPQPQPIQNVLAVGDDLSDSDDLTSFAFSHSQMELARCSRCRRSQSIDMSTGKAANMVSYGLNSFYCLRCANIVGFGSQSR